MSALPSPQMLRVYKDDKKGATAFFRNRPFLELAVSALKGLDHKPRVLFHACSIGAEPYSFAVTARNMGLDVAIDATDIVPDFVQAARMGVYPPMIMESMTGQEQAHFVVRDGSVSVAKDIHDMVNFLPAASLTDFTPDGSYDAVFAMNVLTYLTPDDQTTAIASMADYAGMYLCLTAFHPDQIQADIEAVGFEPVLDNQEIIHSAWGDRIRPEGAKPGTPEYSWVIPPYNTDMPDFNWRYGVLFKRKG